VESDDPEWPKIIEFAGSNNCNFECIMCNGELSSSIRANREGLPPLPKVYSDQFFEDLRPFLPHLKQAKFLGGEPFLAQECFRIWDMMLEGGSKTQCHVTTNASQYNSRVERVLEALPVSLSVSVDGATKDTVEKIRVNSNHDELIRNLHRFREYTKRRGTWMGISHCLMRANWHEFGDVLLLADSLECEVFVNTVLTPEHCSLFTLPPGELDRIVDEMELQGSRLEGKLHLNAEVWRNQLSSLRSNARGRQEGNLTQIQKAAQILRPDDQLVAEGWKLVEAGRLSEAMEKASQLPQHHPHYYQAVLLRAHINFLCGRLEQADADLSSAMPLSRQPFDAYIARAWLRWKQGRFEEGSRDAFQARELCSGDQAREASVYEVLGYIYARAGNLSKATGAVNRLAELRPADAATQVARAEVFEILGLRDHALREIGAALSIDANYTAAIKVRNRLLTGETLH
jgi:Flp pilus assembly protein TadD